MVSNKSLDGDAHILTSAFLQQLIGFTCIVRCGNAINGPLWIKESYSGVQIFDIDGSSYASK